MAQTFFSCCLLFLSISTLSAQLEIRGKVVDSESGEPLAFASIYELSRQTGTTTDIDGNFELTLEDTATIICAYLGYETQVVFVDQNRVINFQMKYSDDLIIECPIIYDSPINIQLPAPFMELKGVQLNRDPNISLLPILNRIPGLHMQSGNLNTNRISIRGIGSRSLFSTTKLRVYLDDIPLTNGSGESSLEDLDLSLIDKIQVWKGPAATMYGAGLGGMIHLKTAARGAVSVPTLFSETTIGSFGLIRNSSGFKIPAGNSSGYLMGNYHLTSQDGYRSNSGFRREGINLLGRFPIGEKSELQFLGLWTKVKAFIPSSLSEADFQNDPEKAADSWQAVRGFETYEQFTLGLSLRSNLAEFNRLYLLSQVSLFTRFSDGYESRPFNILDDSKQAAGLRAVLSLDPDKQLAGLHPEWSLGVELFQDRFLWQTFETDAGQLGDLLSNNREKRSYYNLFAQYYKAFDAGWTILAGLNLSETSYQYVDLYRIDGSDLSGNYSFDPALAMRLGLSYTIQYNYSLFANVSNGFSPPSLEETLTPDGAINPEIQPEKGWNIEVGSRGRPFGNLHYELTVYRMWVRDLLVAQRIDNDQYVGLNAGKTRHDGLELYLDYPITNSSFSIRPFLTYTLTNYRFLDFVDDEADYSGNRLTGVAPHQLFVGTDFSIGRHFFGHLNYEYRSAFPILDDNSLYTDPYQLLHLKLGYRITLWEDWVFDVFGGVQNILDADYASMILINASSFGGAAPRYYYPGMPRHFFGGLKIQYLFD